MSFIVPTAESKRLTSSRASDAFSGNVSGFPITLPTKESLLVMDGSSFVPIATRPPGLTVSTIPAAVPNDTI